ncbi:MAG TPA: VpsF family polysaccharide biosynthesis protein [Lichenihabitans sp.]|jgi:hypothetical protein|nr:VpsF family polysaccharide biosynthesis protein [Lichenihabitans sp.]
MSATAPQALRAVAGMRRDAVRRHPLSLVLLGLAVATLFGVSGGMLWLVGINYDGLTGSAAAKVHPSTYLLFLDVGLVLLRSGDPIGFTRRIAERRPGAVVLFVAASISLADLALRHGPGLAGIVDTFMAAALVVILFMDVDERGIAIMTMLLHGFMAANAVLGLYEFASGHLVFPYRFDGEVFPLDKRSSALQGHPLANAAITCFYVLALIATDGLSLPRLLRLPMLALQFAALVTFGGRIGLVTSLALGAFQGLGRVTAAMRHRRIPLLGTAAILLLAMVLLLAVGSLYEGGFFTALLNRFADDGGSAYARVQMFDMFDGLPLRDLVVGPDPTLIDSTRRILGLEWGIENPFIKTLLYQGLVITLMMTAAVVAYLYDVARAAGRGTLVPMLGFVILASTSESIGGKTTMLTKFAIILICLYGPVRTKRRAALRRPTPSRDPVPGP